MSITAPPPPAWKEQKGAGWTNPPPVILVTGSHEYLRNREMRRALAAASLTGRRVEYVEAGDGESLGGALGGAVLFAEPLLVVVSSGSVRKARKKDADAPDKSGWTEEDVTLVREHHEGGDNEVCLLIVHEGEAPSSSFAGKLREVCLTPKKVRVHDYPAPAPWDLEADAVKFLTTELGRRHKTISPDVAVAVVGVVGTDLGVLSQEALKYSTYLDAVGKPEGVVDVSVVRGLVAGFGAIEYRGLLDALGARSVKGVLRAVREVQDGPVGSRGVTAVARTVGTTSVGWLRVAAMLARGSSPDEVAAQLGWKPTRVQFQLPIIRRWGVEGCKDLVHRMALVDRGSRQGHISPWVEFEVALVRAVTGNPPT